MKYVAGSHLLLMYSDANENERLWVKVEQSPQTCRRRHRNKSPTTQRRIAFFHCRCSSVQPQWNFSSLENTLTQPSAVLLPHSRTSVSLTFTRQSTIFKWLPKCTLFWPHIACAVSSLPIMSMKTHMMHHYHNPRVQDGGQFISIKSFSQHTRQKCFFLLALMRPQSTRSSVASHYVSGSHMIYLANL